MRSHSYLVKVDGMQCDLSPHALPLPWRQFIRGLVTPAALHATLINKNGEHAFSCHLTADQLKPKS